MKKYLNINIVFVIMSLCIYQSVAQAEAPLKIRCYGNGHTHSDVIIKELQLSGQGSMSEQMHRERVWLLRKNVLQKIDFYQNEFSIVDTNTIRVVVQEKSLFSVDPLWDYSRLFGISGGLEFHLFNMHGVWDRLKLGVQVGGLQEYRLSYEVPWFLGFRQLTFNLQGYHYENQYLYQDYPTHFLLRKTGAGGILIKHFGRFHQLGIDFFHEWVRVDDAAVLHGKNIQALQNMSVSWKFDVRDWPIYTHSGYYFSLKFQRVLYQQKKLYDQIESDIRLFWPIGKRNTLGIQSLFTYSLGSLPVYKRLHIGGGSSLRGYSTGYMAGDHCWLSSVEYRFPIVYERNPASGLHVGYAGVFFFDAGTAWFEKDVFDWKQVRGSAGFGIHAIWDHWILRGEYGHRGHSWGFLESGVGVKF